VKHSFVDRYADLDSPLHTLEARTKILGFTVLIAAVLQIPPGSSAAFFLSFMLVAILMGVSQIPLNFIVGRTLLILPFVALAAIAAPWRENLGFTWISTLLMRSVLCLVLLVVLTNTTRFTELLRGLRRLGTPRILVQNLGFLYRYAFVLTDEVMRMRLARECRRVGRLPVRQELRLLGSMLGFLLLRSFERAERMYQAMLSRGHSLDFPVLAPRRFSWGDLVFVLVVVLFLYLVWFLRT
jgi:cobalt/nickel transport system permease protein